MPDDLSICLACERSVHDRCFGPIACSCPCLTPEDPWISPDRRTVLRQIASDGQVTYYLPLHEKAYVEGLLSHRSDREEAEERRA